MNSYLSKTLQSDSQYSEYDHDGLTWITIVIAETTYINYSSDMIWYRSEQCKRAKTAFPKKEKFKRCLAYIGPDYWNKLPNFLKKCKSLVSFKTGMKKYVYQFLPGWLCLSYLMLININDILMMKTYAIYIIA